MDYHEIRIDADAATAIATFDLDHLSAPQRSQLLSEGPGLPYFIRPGAKTLIIGPGGGWDIARSIASGSKDITAVEINPIIANTIMRGRFAPLSHGLYFRPEVSVFIADGRSFVRSSPQKYQVLQATLVDTWASTAAGAFALSENNLYTTDAFHDYLTHLSGDGLMAFTRWGFNRRASLCGWSRLPSRPFGTSVKPSLGSMWSWCARTLTKSPAGAPKTLSLSSANRRRKYDFERLSAGLPSQHLERVYLPGDKPANEFGQLLTAADPKEFLANYPFDVSPVNDDRPFFFYTVQPRDVWSFLEHPSDAADYKINRALPLLFELLGVSLLATLIVLALAAAVVGRAACPPGRVCAAFFCISFASAQATS